MDSESKSIDFKPVWQLKASIILKIFLGVFGFSLIFLAFSLSQSSLSHSNTEDSNNLNVMTETLIENEIEISVYNEYSKRVGQPGQKYPWIKFPVVEPYRPTTLEAIFKADKEDEDDYITYYWLINDKVLESEGRIIQFEFRDLAYHDIEVKRVDKRNGEILQSGFRKVVCRYVRREIRALTDEDREAFFEASYVIYNTPNLEGQQKYGSKFKDIMSLVIWHNIRAGDILCDHMHDGYGFLTSHYAYTLAFEQSIQSVDPKVTVPYWDFTIEGHQIETTGSFDAFYNSIVFSDDWFGESVPADKVVTGGRFGYTKVESFMFNQTSTYNAYGLLRSPWNQNKIPYITRFNGMCGYRIIHFPTCTSHYELLQIKKFEEFAKISQYIPHGSIHTALGGIWGADWLSYTREWGYNMSADVDNFLFVYLKIMYRTRVLQCPEYCSLDTPTTECKCTCPNFETIANNKAQLSKLMETIFGGKIEDDFELRFFELLCNRYDDLAPITGDHLESASPNDISFWPIHPTIDRLFQWRRINGLDSMHWTDDAAWSLWSGTVPATGYCKGHNLNDVVGFEDLFAPKFPGTYTNADILHFTNPENDFSPYVYDFFEWEHCTEEGFSLTLLEEHS